MVSGGIDLHTQTRVQRVKRSLGRGKEESARHRRARQAGSRVDGSKRWGGGA